MATAPKRTTQSAKTKPLSCHALWVTRGASDTYAKLDRPDNASNTLLWAANEAGYLMLSPEGEAAYAANKPTKATTKATTASAAKGLSAGDKAKLRKLIAAGIDPAEALEILS